MKPVAGERPKVEKPDSEWRAELSDDEYAVLRQAGTERPWTGEYVDTKTVGVYSCRACGAELFRSDTKFESHCGWPSFWSPLAADRVILREDRSLGTLRTELTAGTVSKVGALLAKPAFDRVRKTLDYEEYGGVPVLGVNGISIICHGRSHAKAIKIAVHVAIQSADAHLPERIAEGLRSLSTGAPLADEATSAS